MIGRRVENDRRGGHRGDGAHLADELVAIHGRHQDVADDQMGPLALDECERFGAVRRLENAVPLIPEQRGKEESIDGAIFCDEDARHVPQSARNAEAMNLSTSETNRSA